MRSCRPGGRVRCSRTSTGTHSWTSTRGSPSARPGTPTPRWLRPSGSLRLTASRALYHRGFGPLLPGVLPAPSGDQDPALEFIREAIFTRLVGPEEIAAVVVEPVQERGATCSRPTGGSPSSGTS